MEQQIELDNKRYELKVQYRQDQRNDKQVEREEHESDRIEQQTSWAERIGLVSQWMSKGQSANDIQILAMAAYGAWKCL